MKRNFPTLGLHLEHAAIWGSPQVVEKPAGVAE